MLDKDILYHWYTESLLPILTPNGVWVAPNPAPLRADEIVPIFERIAEHPDYQHQLLSTATEDGRVVHLSDGMVKDEPIEGTPFEGAPSIFKRTDP